MHVRNEQIGDGGWNSGGAGAWWGIWIFAFLIIFFIVLVFMWRRDHKGHGFGLDGLGGLAGLLPLLQGKFCRNDEDHRVEQARDTGKIVHDMDKNAAYLESKIDRNLIELKDDRIRELERKHIEEKMMWLNERTEGAIGRAEGRTERRLDHIERCMIKEPRFAAFGTHESYFRGEEPRGECRR